LSQGFEVFDDSVSFSQNRLYRPVDEVTKAFLGWLDRIGGSTFFSVIYLADLQFPEVASVSDLGEVRDRSDEAQLREVAEGLAGLIRTLKAKGLWHRMHVILVGLNGSKSGAHPSEIRPLNVFADNTQVSLYLKPARRTQDLGPQWTIDKNVSLADVGLSLFEFVGAEPPAPELVSLPRVSLFGFVNQPQAEWADERTILVESAWGEWRWLSNIRYAARRRHYLYVHDAKPKIFNTLLDRLEANPLAPSDPLWLSLEHGMMAVFRDMELARWEVRDEKAWERLLGAQQWWLDRNFVSEGPILSLLPVTDIQARRWRAERLLAKGDWPGLQALGEQSREPLYAFVAKLNLGQSAKVPPGRCSRFFDPKPKKRQRLDLVCGDDMLVRVAEWANSEDDGRRERAFESFIHLYRAARLESELGAANYARLLPWDVSVANPYGLHFAELYLALPDRRPLAGTVKARLSREDQGLDL
jgi:hypothetical protein